MISLLVGSSGLIAMSSGIVTFLSTTFKSTLLVMVSILLTCAPASIPCNFAKSSLDIKPLAVNDANSAVPPNASQPSLVHA